MRNSIHCTCALASGGARSFARAPLAVLPNWGAPAEAQSLLNVCVCLCVCVSVCLFVRVSVRACVRQLESNSMRVGSALQCAQISRNFDKISRLASSDTSAHASGESTSDARATRFLASLARRLHRYPQTAAANSSLEASKPPGDVTRNVHRYTHKHKHKHTQPQTGTGTQTHLPHQQLLSSSSTQTHSLAAVTQYHRTTAILLLKASTDAFILWSHRSNAATGPKLDGSRRYQTADTLVCL